jgi:hypothetical protein
MKVYHAQINFATGFATFESILKALSQTGSV